MKRAWMASITTVSLLVLGTVAYAGQPAGVGLATVEKGFNCFVAALAYGAPTPIYPGAPLGLVVVALTRSTLVESNSANGNTNLSCQGRVPFGTMVTAYDPATREEITVTLATREESCAVLGPIFPGVCRGNGATILNSDTVPFPCQIAPGISTNDWRQINSPGDQVSLTCEASNK